MQQKFTLVIGNKNTSSWSLRAWLMLKATGAPFKEVLVRLYEKDSKEKILRYSPSGQVPVLLVGKKPIWESLAIGEYLAESFPKAKLWPKDATARAHARSISSEMHAEFAALRRDCSMNIRKREVAVLSPEVSANVARIERLWKEARKMAGKGDFLYGHFTVADAMYAPVVGRCVSYGIKVGKDSRRYMNAIQSHPAYAQWVAAALEEP